MYTSLSARRVLVTDYVDGPRTDVIGGLDDAERDRIGEIAFRFYFGLLWRDGIVAGDPHPDNCILTPDGRLCVLDFGLLRDIDADYLRRRARRSSGRSPPPMRRASMTACRTSAICRTRERSTRTRCSRTSRPPASG